MAEKEPLHTWSKNAKEYRLVGRQHSGYSKDGMTREEFKTGDKVMLEPHEYEAFGDKFEPLKQNDEPAEEPKAQTTKPAVATTLSK